MSGVRNRGFTLVELLVAFVLWAVVGTAAVSVLVAGQRGYRRHQELAQANATVRAAATILTGELRGSDLLRGDRTSVTYRAPRNLYVTCDKPDLDRSTVLLRADFLGYRPLDPDVDSLLLFADGDPATRDDDRWIHADLREISPGSSCPDGARGVTARLAGAARRSLEAVGVGAPVRGAAVWEMKGYRDSRGEWWVGMRRYHKADGRWPVIQPVLGPIASGGLVLMYRGPGGLPTDAPDRAATVDLAVAVPRGAARSPHSAVTGEGWLNLRVTLRNALSR
jgi:prepilin-type N-terminal cleavage/methylation domain-containing protein